MMPMPLGGAALFARLEDVIEKEAVFWQGQLDVIWFAVENGIINPTTFRAHGKTLLHAATSWDNVDLLRYLVVERGTDPNLPDALWISALVYALDDMREEVAHFFINEAPGCKIDARVPLCSPSSGMTPLMVAAKRGMLPAVQALIAKGADVCATSDTGGTALGWATYEKMEDCALELLAAGASWRGSVEGWGLLKLAAANNLPRLVRALVRRMRVDGEKEAAVMGRMAEAARAAAVEGRVASLRACGRGLGRAGGALRCRGSLWGHCSLGAVEPGDRNRAAEGGGLPHRIGVRPPRAWGWPRRLAPSHCRRARPPAHPCSGSCPHSTSTSTPRMAIAPRPCSWRRLTVVWTWCSGWWGPARTCSGRSRGGTASSGGLQRLRRFSNTMPWPSTCSSRRRTKC